MPYTPPKERKITGFARKLVKRLRCKAKQVYYNRRSTTTGIDVRQLRAEHKTNQGQNLPKLPGVIGVRNE